MLKIGGYKLDTNVLLAPMAGVTDLPFRLICREYGAKFAFFEMIDCNSIIYGRNKESDIIKTTAKDKPIAGQLVGAEPELMLMAAKELLKMADIKFLDINAACPVKKMIKKKAGAYFIKDPETLYTTIKLLTSKLDLPITVKLRTGYQKADHKWIREIAKNCEKNGASALFVHGRTQKQGYSGDVDHEAIRAIKDSVNVPVFGSGNIFGPEDAKIMIDRTGCDGVMVARGAYGDPWIFSDIEKYLDKGTLPEKRSIEEKLKALKKHLAYIEKYRSMRHDGKLGLMRKVAQWYMKDFPNACHLRRVMNGTKTYEQLDAVIKRSPELMRIDGEFPSAF